MSKHISFRERFYTTLANDIVENIDYFKDNKNELVECHPFTDNNKWCEYRISCNITEEEEGDCDDGYIGYYQVQITKLEINVAIWSDEENGIKYFPLDVDLTELTNMVNDILYNNSWDIFEDDDEPIWQTWKEYWE